MGAKRSAGAVDCDTAAAPVESDQQRHILCVVFLPFAGYGNGGSLAGGNGDRFGGDGNAGDFIRTPFMGGDGIVTAAGLSGFRGVDMQSAVR